MEGEFFVEGVESGACRSTSLMQAVSDGGGEIARTHG
jgi:hypothetical protein